MDVAGDDWNRSRTLPRRPTGSTVILQELKSVLSAKESLFPDVQRSRASSDTPSFSRVTLEAKNRYEESQSSNADDSILSNRTTQLAPSAIPSQKKNLSCSKTNDSEVQNCPVGSTRTTLSTEEDRSIHCTPPKKLPKPMRRSIRRQQSKKIAEDIPKESHVLLPKGKEQESEQQSTVGLKFNRAEVPQVNSTGEINTHKRASVILSDVRAQKNSDMHSTTVTSESPLSSNTLTVLEGSSNNERQAPADTKTSKNDIQEVKLQHNAELKYLQKNLLQEHLSKLKRQEEQICRLGVMVTEKEREIRKYIEALEFQAKQYIADLNEVRAACEKAMRDRDTALTEKQVLSQNLEKAQSEVEALRKKRQTAKSKNKMAENHQLRQTAESLMKDVMRLREENKKLQAKLKQDGDELVQYCISDLPSMGECQGYGSFGSVYPVRLNGINCVAKRIHDILLGHEREEKVGLDAKKAAYDKFHRECVLLSRMRHPNIVQFMGVHYGPERDYGKELTLIMERLYMNLEDSLKKYDNIENWLKVSILLDISQGLLHLHSEGIVHRDLTAANILLTTSFHAKIADLGVSKIIDVHPNAASKLSMIPGSLGYMPPEALFETPVYSFPLDIFSFGVLMLYVLIQEYPQFYELSNVTYTGFQRGDLQVRKRMKWIEKLSLEDPMRQLICQCLQDDPQRRPPTTELNSSLIKFTQQYPKPFPDTIQMSRRLTTMSQLCSAYSPSSPGQPFTGQPVARPRPLPRQHSKAPTYH